MGLGCELVGYKADYGSPAAGWGMRNEDLITGHGEIEKVPGCFSQVFFTLQCPTPNTLRRYA